MTLFGIRHKPSGRLMPAVRGRGSTALNFHVEGFEADFARHKLRPEPRLFAVRVAAQRALSAWLKGEWVQHQVRSGMYGEDFDVYTEPPRNPPEDRKSQDMEIIEFELTERKAKEAPAEKETA